MTNIVGVVFNKGAKKQFYDSNNLDLKKGMLVIANSDQGQQVGEVYCITNIKDRKLSASLEKITRIATSADKKTYEKNMKDADLAINECNKLIKKHKLEMKLVGAYFTFDRKQLIFHFLAENRVDFRELAKDLAQIYKTRIELRQIGVRDKAKETGGLGLCGRALCCSKFLNEFDSISINMAKNQNLALTPSKINGVCGRMLCCLKYENEIYKENRKKLPAEGDKIKTKDVEGKVVSVDVLAKSYYVETKEKELVKVQVEQ
ncbi:MAG: regulatory iron-sulfur-containing complex subunit RicT [Bacilli bacterium]|nr:regulatory iron-sulfur-containing complex subunit RicT [Bacilli bacterium]